MKKILGFFAVSLISLLPEAQAFTEYIGQRTESQFGAIKSEWEASPCKNIEVSSINEIQDYLTRLEGTRSDALLSGVQVRGENTQLINAYQQLLSRGPKLTAEMEACSDVICLVKSIWGAELGPKILYAKVHHGVNLSEYAAMSTKRITVGQVNEVLITLADMPAHLQKPQDKANLKISVSTSQRKGAMADARINQVRLYESWVNLESHPAGAYLRQYALYHEIGHVRGFHGGLFGSHSGGEWKAVRASECFVSKYSRTNAVEDFAETFATYRYNGPGLREKCPAKFEYMKNKIFRGIEYTDEIACQRAPVAPPKNKSWLEELNLSKFPRL